MKSIKFIFVMAALAATLAFVSCSNEAQDVNVTFNPTSTSYRYYGSVTGAVKFTYTTTDKVSVRSDEPLACVSYSTGYWVSSDGMSETKTNAEHYYLEVPVKVTYDTIDGTSFYKNTACISIKKIGDSYYNSYDDEKLEVSGSLEDDEFTVTGKIKDEDNRYEFSTITFTRK